MAKQKVEITCLSAYIENMAEKKNLSTAEWWNSVIPNVSKCQLSSHVGKFTHPDVKSAVWNENHAVISGYVSSESILVEPDILTPAQYLGAASFLMQPVFQNGPTVVEDLENGGEEIQKELGKLALDFTPLKEAYHEMIKESRHMPQESDSLLKQVYFPIGNGDYHLLSIMTASGLLGEVKNRVQSLNWNTAYCHTSKNENYGGDCCEIRGLVQISFGGTKPQNISVLNSRQKGSFVMLRSLPPSLQDKSVRAPQKDFFSDTLYYGRYKDTFTRLHHLMQIGWNNKDIRDAIKECALDLVDDVLELSYSLRGKEAGWSETSKLPESQKIWLDAAYDGKRKEYDWIPEVSLSFGRWLIFSYEKLLGNDKILLGDGELHFFRDQMEEVLQEEVRNE